MLKISIADIICENDINLFITVYRHPMYSFVTYRYSNCQSDVCSVSMVMKTIIQSNKLSGWDIRDSRHGGTTTDIRVTHEQCCQIGRFSAGYFCLRQVGKKYIGRVNKIWAAFVHIWQVFNIVKTALSLF